MLDWRDGGVLDVAPLMGASCLETWLGCSMLHFSGVRRGSRLISRGAMYAIAGESKTAPFSGPTKSRHLPLLCNGASTMGVQLEMLIFGGDQRWLRRGDVDKLRTSSSFFVVVWSGLAVFGLALEWSLTTFVVSSEL